MAQGKVINLSIPKRATRISADESKQFDLFEGYHDCIFLAFIDVDLYDQEMLLRIVAKYQFELIFDLRNKPVFKKPKYDHKYVMSYLYRRSVEYFDSGRFFQEFNGEADEMIESMSDLILRVGSDRFANTICLFDKQAEFDGVVSIFRQELNSAAGNIIEINPRSIA